MWLYWLVPIGLPESIFCGWLCGVLNGLPEKCLEIYFKVNDYVFYNKYP